MLYLFTTKEYADKVFTLGVCNGNATVAAVEYERRYPNRRIPDSKTISGTFQELWETGTLLSILTSYEHSIQHHADIDEIIIDTVQHSPGISTQEESES